MLESVVPLIQKVVNGRDLTWEEARDAFIALETYDDASYHFFAFTAALHAKGETADELLGFCRANEHFVSAFETGIDAEALIDISGTGGDVIKTPNISTAAAFVIASHGIKVAKQAFFAVTGISGSADLMGAFDIDPLASSRNGPEWVRDVLAKTGMVVYHANSMADPEQRKGFFNLMNRRREIGLNYVTTYHLAANAYSPIPMSRRVYGVFDERYLVPLAELYRNLGYDRAMIVNGVDGLDEMSNIGATRIVELIDGEMREYSVSPEEMGVVRSNKRDITIESKEQAILDVVRVLYGAEMGPKRDLVVVNAAAGLYIMNAVASLREGVQLAQELIDDGAAASKLEDYVAACGDPELLQGLHRSAGLA